MPTDGLYSAKSKFVRQVIYFLMKRLYLDKLRFSLIIFQKQIVKFDNLLPLRSCRNLKVQQGLSRILHKPIPSVLFYQIKIIWLAGISAVYPSLEYVQEIAARI